MSSNEEMVISLDKETIQTLDGVNDINQSIKFIGGSELVKVKSTDNTQMIHAPITSVFPRDFHVYDIREFLSAVSIIEEPELDFSDDKSVIIRSQDGKQKLTFIEASEEFVRASYVEKEPPMDEAIAELTVTGAQFSTVMKAANVMKLDFVGFVSDGSKVYLRAFNKNNGSDAVTNAYEVELGDSDVEYTMIYKRDVQNISFLAGEGDLSFYLTERKISKVETESGKKFWLTMNVDSEYKG